MKKIFNEYGGVMTVVISVVALIGLVVFLMSDTGAVSNAFGKITQQFVDAADEMIDGAGSDGLIGEDNGVTLAQGGQVYSMEEPTTLSFRSSAPLTEFQEVRVNGEVLSEDNYVVTEGSIIITLKIEYLETLAEGTYTITVVSDTAAPSVTFTVVVKIEGGAGSGSEEVGLAAGLYDSVDNLVASWDELTTTYGMDVMATYTSDTYKTDTASPYYVLTNNSELSDGVQLVIDGSVTNIGNFAFYNCTRLRSIEIPDSVTSIGRWAFVSCTSLESVDFGDNSQLTSIGDSAFNGCTSLTNIEIPDRVTSIDSSTFSSCTSLTSIEIPASVTNVGSVAFASCTSLESVTFGDNSQLTSIGSSAFWECANLTSVDFGDNSQLTSISQSAFRDCTSLTSIEIPDSVTYIGDAAFYNCTSLASVDIGGGVTSIGTQAFLDCTNLTSIEIPASVTSIGQFAFDGCTSLESVTFGENSQLTSIEQYAFQGCTSLTAVYITDLSAWCNISFGMNAANPLYYAKNLYIDGELADDIAIPSDVTSIGNGVFQYCDSLTSVEIPASVTSIGANAFYSCTSLASVTFGDNSQLTNIDNSAFASCTSLESIEIPAGVTIIGWSVFSGCTSLTSMSFEGTKEQWSTISLGLWWNRNVPATEVVCSDGTVTLI